VTTFEYALLCRSQAMTARSPWERRLCFAPPFLMRMLIMTLRCFGIGGGSPEALTHIILQVCFIYNVVMRVKQTLMLKMKIHF
jgi:hypothetical protein